MEVRLLPAVELLLQQVVQLHLLLVADLQQVVVLLLPVFHLLQAVVLRQEVGPHLQVLLQPVVLPSVVLLAVVHLLSFCICFFSIYLIFMRLEKETEKWMIVIRQREM